jgi:hypothetical protein
VLDGEGNEWIGLEKLTKRATADLDAVKEKLWSVVRESDRILGMCVAERENE